MSADNQIDYIEFQATDLAATRTFFEQLFGWKFTDYGPDYTSFEDGGSPVALAAPRNAPPSSRAGCWWCSIIRGWRKRGSA